MTHSHTGNLCKNEKKVKSRAKIQMMLTVVMLSERTQSKRGHAVILAYLQSSKKAKRA